MNDRIDRLRERLEEPLLVSSPANVRYLCGLASSNAALVVEPERVRLYTDFRYAETARAIEGVELVDAKRDLYQTLSEQLSGTIGFEATSLSFEHYSRLHAGGIEPVPRYGLVEELRAVKDEDELDAIRRASEIANIGVRALRRRGRHRRPHRARARVALRAVPARRQRGGRLVPRDDGVGPERGQAAHRAQRSRASSPARR